MTTRVRKIIPSAKQCVEILKGVLSENNVPDGYISHEVLCKLVNRTRIEPVFMRSLVEEGRANGLLIVSGGSEKAVTFGVHIAKYGYHTLVVY